MSTMDTTTSARQGVLPDTLRLGAVELNVTDVDRSTAFYQDILGLQVHSQDVGTSALGVGGEDLVVLHENPRARPAGRHAGLYHVALLYPTREELARAVMRLANSRTMIEGASDHGVSEAIYLPDPDGNGLELYADRPRDRWPAPAPGERIGMFTAALDLDGLVRPVMGEEPRRQAGPGLSVGHVHLHVGDLARATAFYDDVLGFEPMAHMPSAAFVSAGGYHHHLGLNTWRGEGAPPVPDDAVGLRRWTIVLDDAGQVDAVRRRLSDASIESTDRDGAVEVRDPWGIPVLVTTAA
jgi:catechol 2,3-dioxygenase